MRPLRIARTLPIRPLAISILLLGSAADAAAQLTLRLADYATMPVTGVPDGVGNDGSLARVNFMREEPGGARRFFVNDLNGPLYILDKETKQFSVYLDFNGSGTKTGLFRQAGHHSGLPAASSAFSSIPTTRRTAGSTPFILKIPKMPGSCRPGQLTFSRTENRRVYADAGDRRPQAISIAKPC